MELSSLEELQRRTFDFFQKYTNLDEQSDGYGLTIDHSEREGIASIAATGFFLSSIVIGVNQTYITYEEGYKQVKKTLETLLYRAAHFKGFFSHMLNINDASRYKKSEYSTIDTMLCLHGVITVSKYFDEDIENLANQIIKRVDWLYFVFKKEDKTYLRMAYNPDKDGDYVMGESGFIHQWDMFAEQLGMYVLIADKHPEVGRRLYQSFQRFHFEYDDIKFIGTPGNSLFVYQFPLCWLDLKNIEDKDGINWFENAKKATLVHQKFCVKHTEYKTFSNEFFGLTACDSPKGYRVFHSLPNVFEEPITDGTISPCGPLGSLPFTPQESIKAFNEMIKVEHLYTTYGFKDAFNFENGRWVSKRYYGINQGLILLMVNAYLSKDVYHEFMNHPITKKGMDELLWTKK